MLIKFTYIPYLAFNSLSFLEWNQVFHPCSVVTKSMFFCNAGRRYFVFHNPSFINGIILKRLFSSKFNGLSLFAHGRQCFDAVACGQCFPFVWSPSRSDSLWTLSAVLCKTTVCCYFKRQQRFAYNRHCFWIHVAGIWVLAVCAVSVIV